MMTDFINGVLLWGLILAAIAVVVTGFVNGAEALTYSASEQAAVVDLTQTMPAQGGDAQAILLPPVDINKHTNCAKSGTPNVTRCNEIVFFQRPGGSPLDGSQDIYTGYVFAQGTGATVTCPDGESVKSGGTLTSFTLAQFNQNNDDGTPVNPTTHSVIPMNCFSVHRIAATKFDNDSDDLLSGLVANLEAPITNQAPIDVTLNFGVPKDCANFCVTGDNALYHVTGLSSKGFSFDFMVGQRSVAPTGQIISVGSYAPTPPPNPSSSKQNFKFFYPSDATVAYQLSEKNYHDPFFTEVGQGSNCPDAHAMHDTSGGAGTTFANGPNPDGQGYTFISGTDSDYHPGTEWGQVGQWLYPAGYQNQQPADDPMGTVYTSYWGMNPDSPGYCGVGFYDTFTARTQKPLDPANLPSASNDPMYGYVQVMGQLALSGGPDNLTGTGAAVSEIDLSVGAANNGNCPTLNGTGVAWCFAAGKTFTADAFNTAETDTGASGSDCAGVLRNWGSGIDVGGNVESTPDSTATARIIDVDPQAAGYCQFTVAVSTAKTYANDTEPPQGPVDVYVSSALQEQDDSTTSGTTYNCTGTDIGPGKWNIWIAPNSSQSGYQQCQISFYKQWDPNSFSVKITNGNGAAPCGALGTQITINSPSGGSYSYGTDVATTVPSKSSLKSGGNNHTGNFQISAAPGNTSAVTCSVTIGTSEGDTQTLTINIPSIGPTVTPRSVLAIAPGYSFSWKGETCYAVAFSDQSWGTPLAHWQPPGLGGTYVTDSEGCFIEPNGKITANMTIGLSQPGYDGNFGESDSNCSSYIANGQWRGGNDTGPNAYWVNVTAAKATPSCWMNFGDAGSTSPQVHVQIQSASSGNYVPLAIYCYSVAGHDNQNNSYNGVQNGGCYDDQGNQQYGPNARDYIKKAWPNFTMAWWRAWACGNYSGTSCPIQQSGFNPDSTRPIIVIGNPGSDANQCIGNTGNVGGSFGLRCARIFPAQGNVTISTSVEDTESSIAGGNSIDPCGQNTSLINCNNPGSGVCYDAATQLSIVGTTNNCTFSPAGNGNGIPENAPVSYFFTPQGANATITVFGCESCGSAAVAWDWEFIIEFVPSTSNMPDGSANPNPK